MSKMNFKDWPVADMTDFDAVVVDATKWGDDGYSAVFNFVHKYSDQGNEGFTLMTQVIGSTLREVYQQVTAIINLGFFDGSNVQAHGALYDEEHNELATICWHQYSDEEWDSTDDDSQGLSTEDGFDAELIVNFPAPTTIQ